MSKRKTLEGWSNVKVKDILDRVRNPVEVIKDENYTQIGIRSHGKGIFYKEPVTGEELGNKAVFWIEPDCFIVNIVFAWEMAVARTTRKDKGYIASHRFPMYKPKKEILDLDFITYLFKSSRGKYLLNLASPGGAGRNKTLGQKEFEEINILLPTDIEEQRKIASILINWDKAIELKEKLIEQKKEQKKGLMQKLLTGENRLPGYDEKWEKVDFEEVFIRIPIKKNQIKTNEYLKSGKFPVVDQGKEKIVAYSNDELKVFQVDSGVIIFGDHTRERKFIDFDFIVGADGTQVLNTNDGFNIKFYYYCLLNKYIPNTGYNRHFKFLKEMWFYKPSLKEQIDIAELLANIDEEIKLLSQELKIVRQQKAGLMQQLLTGKIRVKV